MLQALYILEHSRTTSYPIYETYTCFSKDISVMLVNRPLKNCQKYAQITVFCVRRDAEIYGQFRRRCLLLVVNFLFYNFIRIKQNFNLEIPGFEGSNPGILGLKNGPGSRD
jgi:hypothetical protein